MTTPQPDNYMRAAAEKAINDLQNQVNYAMDAAERAEAAAKSAKADAANAQSSARKWKKFTVAALALVIVVASLGTWVYFGFKHQAVNACNIGNERAQSTVAVIDELVILLEGPHPTATTKKKAAAYDAYVASHNQVRDCSHAYSIFP